MFTQVGMGMYLGCITRVLMRSNNNVVETFFVAIRQNILINILIEAL